MSDRSSEVRGKHALAGTEGHSHLVIWVNYKWGRLQQGKMSWTAVSPETHTNSSTAHMDCSLCWAPDPVGLSWMRSPQWQPGETGEKFTSTAAKVFHASSFSSPFKGESKLACFSLSVFICTRLHLKQRSCRFLCERLMIHTCDTRSVISPVSTSFSRSSSIMCN